MNVIVTEPVPKTKRALFSVKENKSDQCSLDGRVEVQC